MKGKEYINISKLSKLSKISYDKVYRAVRFDVTETFSVEEKKELLKASEDLINIHQKAYKELQKALK